MGDKMKSINELVALADKFEKMAQDSLAKTPQVSAQQGDIQTTLERANMWNKQDEVAQLVSASKIPDSVSVAISILADKAMNINFTVVTNPHDAGSLKLTQLLKQKYSQPMRAIIQKSGLNVANVMEVPWIRFDAAGAPPSDKKHLSNLEHTDSE
jgi:hypothetical protein